MLVVGNSIVSDNIKDVKFCCNLSLCKGMCCVQGDAGAPLEKKEIKIIENYYSKIKPYMTKEGIEEVDKYGIDDEDISGELCTRIIDGKDCVFLTLDNDIAMCAIEKAYLDNVIDFRKPISCHLYPIRVQDYGEFQAVNYHEWDICKSALEEGEKQGTPLYVILKEPLVRKFGQKWYDELLAQI